MIKESSSYLAAFRALQEKSAMGGTSWINRLRETAMDRFEQSGFPTTRDEEWKYTNVASIAQTNFELSTARDLRASIFTSDDLEPFVYEEARRSQLVFVNGIFRAELSTLEALPSSVIALSLIEALDDETQASVLRDHLARLAVYDDNAFTALNTAFIGNGALLRIPKGVRVEAPLHLLFLSDPRETTAPPVSFPRVLIVAERDSEATVVESYASVADGAYLTNAVVEFVLEDGARVGHYKVQRESSEGFHVATTVAELGRHSNLDSTTITLGAQLSRHDIRINLEAEAAECVADGLYLVTTGQHTDTHSVIDHRKAHCTSHQLYKGILDGKSRAVFNGKIFVREDAQQTNAMQTNRNLLLSGDARVDTKPQLEIFADDVKCTHGATVGQLEEEELFYLLSRGLSPDLARNLLTYGFAEQVINKIKIASIKAQLDEAVLNRLHARFEPQTEVVK
ncbi:MAG: Fe-S cluster assembly protein SufD [Pyrinomonadaceae bacterium]